MKPIAIATLIIALFGIVVMSFFTGILFGSAIFGDNAELLANQDMELAGDIALTRAAVDKLTERILALEKERSRHKLYNLKKGGD